MLLFVLLFFVPTLGRADLSSGPALGLRGSLEAGYSSVTRVSGKTTPTLVHYGAGITGTVTFFDLLLAGASTDFTWLNQHSDVQDSGGNFRGTRWNLVSPTLGFAWGSYVFLGDFEFLGRYLLLRSAEDGSEVSYTSPSGFRLRGLMDLYDWGLDLDAGLSFRYLSFGKTMNSKYGESSLSKRRALWEIGFLISYAYDL